MPMTRKKKIKQAVKTRRFTNKITQHDADGAGGPQFIKTTPEEEKSVIEGKMRERIKVQEELRKNNLVSLYQYTEIEALENIYNNYDESPFITEDINGTQVTRPNPNRVERPKWYGIDMPKKLLAAELKIKVHRFTEIMRHIEYLKSQLSSVGFMKKDLEYVMSGKLIKDFKKLRKMEEKTK